MSSKTYQSRKRPAVTQGERIATLETKVEELTNKVTAMNGKLDALLAFQHKGVGAFWLASALTGTGIVGFIGWFFNLFKGS